MNGNKWFLLIIIGAALILGTASLALAQDDNAAIFERYIEQVWNKGMFSLFGAVVNRDVVQHDSTLPEPVTGAAALVDYIQKGRSDLPAIEFTVDSMVTEGDLVTADLTATLKDAQVPLEAKARIADGRLVETWFDVNALVSNPDIEAAVAQVEADNLALMDQWNEFYNHLTDYTADFQQFVAKYSTLVKDGYTGHGMFANGSSYIATYSSEYAWYGSIARAFPDMNETLDSVVAHGDRVYVLYTATGTFQNPWELPGESGWITLQPTGKQVVETGAWIVRIEDGKIVEQWWYVDNPAFWVDVALLLERGYGWGSVAQEIYNLNKPK